MTDEERTVCFSGRFGSAPAVDTQYVRKRTPVRSHPYSSAHASVLQCAARRTARMLRQHDALGLRKM